MVEGPRRAMIAARLAAIEQAHGVEVLFAAESGSRAWGFASADSDFDVRFVYRHPAAWYVGLSEPRDVIEYPLDDQLLDVAGWDLRKALRLLLRSNPPLHEWLVSPIVYREQQGVGAAMRDLFERFADPRRLLHHYVSMARGQRDLLGPKATVRRKRYLYIARPLLAVRLLAGGHWPPPMAIGALMQTASPEPPVAAALARLIAEKQAGGELGEGPRDAVLDGWIAAELAAATPDRVPQSAPVADGTAAVTRFFHDVIGFAARAPVNPGAEGSRPDARGA